MPLHSCICMHLSSGCLPFSASEEYCSSSRAFGSWRRFGVSPRSWELYLLLTRAVLIRRRKTLRHLSAGISSGDSSQGPATPRDEDTQTVAACLLKSAASAADGTLTLSPADARIDSAPKDQLDNVLRAVSEATVTPNDAQRFIKDLPWGIDCSGACEALVLPPCTRIVQPLLLQCSNKLLTAIAHGLVLQGLSSSSLLDEAQQAAAVTEELVSGSSSGSDDALSGSSTLLSTGCVDAFICQLLGICTSVCDCQL